MRTTYVPLPGDGVFCQGHRPSNLEVTEVPPVVSDGDLAAFVGRLCATRQGLQLTMGFGPNASQYSLNFRTLLQMAKARGVDAPEVPVPPSSPLRGRYFTAEGETNEHGQLLNPRHAAPASPKPARSDGFIEG